MNISASVSKTRFFYTDSLKLAGALSAAGFPLKSEIIDGERVITGLDKAIVNGKEVLTFEFEPVHNGLKAIWFLGAFENKFDLGERVDQIIRDRGLTPEEQSILAFDGARTGLHNVSTAMFVGRNRRPVKEKDIGGGRSIIYREGTDREHLKNLIKNV
jgi:hypothetical protein